MSAQIGISYLRGLPEEFIHDFRVDTRHERLHVAVRERESGIYAGLELLIETAVVIYVTKAYFDGFLNEMGKEHYHLLKGALKKLGRRMRRFPVSAVGSPGKLSKSPIYTFAYSIVVSTDGVQFKLLIQEGVSEKQQDEAIEMFMTFAKNYYLHSLDEETLQALANYKSISRMILVAANLESKRIEFIDPRPKRLVA